MAEPQDNTLYTTRLYLEPIKHPLADKLHNITVEDYLNALAEHERQSTAAFIPASNTTEGLVYKYTSSGINNTKRLLEWNKLQEELKKQLAALAANTLLALTMPSTYIGLATGAMDPSTGEAKNNLAGTIWDDTRFIQDIAAFGVPTLVKAGLKKAVPVIRNNYRAYQIAKAIDKLPLKILKPSRLLDLEDGFLFHNGEILVHPAGFNGKKFTTILQTPSPGALAIVDDKFVSVRLPHYGNPDRIWWDTSGHNTPYRSKVYVTKLDDSATKVIGNQTKLNIPGEHYSESYYVTDPKPTSLVIEYRFDPISGTPVPHMPNKILTNKMTYDEILNAPTIDTLRLNKGVHTSLVFFERPSKLTEAEKLGIPKGDRNKIIIDRGEMLDKKFRWIDGELIPEYTYNPDAPPAFMRVKNWDISDGKPFTDAAGKVLYKFRPRRDPEIDYTDIPITDWGDDLKNPQFMREDPTFGFKTSRTAFLREEGLNAEDIKMSEILKNVASKLNVSDDLIKAFDNNVIATRFRLYYWNKGYSLDRNLTQQDIAKIVAENYAQLTKTQSGKLKNLILWNGSPEILHYNPLTKLFTLLREGAPDQFKIINNGYRTSHSDIPGIYFNTQPVSYDNAIVTTDKNLGNTLLVQAFPNKVAYSATPGDKQPFLINNVKNVIRGDLPISLSTTPKNTVLHTSKFKGTIRAYPQDPLNGDEFFTTNIEDIKGLFPHPNLFVENADGTWSMIRSWDNPGLHYKSGGSIHIKKKNKGKFTASAKAAGKGVQEYAHKVMNDPNATSLQKKRANFAIQAKKWHHKHQLGGKINYLNLF